MTYQQLLAIDSHICQNVQNPPGRLLLHALDTNLLSDEDYLQISNHDLAENQLQEAPWAIALFWGRLFYKKSDGNNYRRIIQDGLRITHPDELFDRIHEVCGWFPVDDEILRRRVYRFQSECWLTSEEGETSRLWKSLPRLIRNAIPGASDEQICEAAGADEEDITPPIRWLLKQRDPDFCHTLRWLQGGENAQEAAPGNAVARAIAENPINAHTRKNDDCDAFFGLRVSAHRAELVLGIRNLHFGEHDPGNTRSLEITQDGQTLLSTFVGKQSRSIILGPEAFMQRPDFSRSIGFRFGNKTLVASDIIPLPWGGNYLLMFRKSYAGDISRFIAREVDGLPSHVQGRYFYLLGRPGVQQSPALSFDGNPQNLTPCGMIENQGIVRHLFGLDLGMLHGEPLPLMELGAECPLAIIGRKSFLSIDSTPSGWQLHGGNETPVLIGCTLLTLTPENFVGNQIGISVSDQQGNHLLCEPLPNDPSKFGLSIGENHWGKEWRIRATSENPGDTASTELLFLPGLDVPGVQWTPSQLDPSLRFSLAQHHGLEDGTLSYPGGTRQVLRPLQHPTWAWKNGPMGVSRDFDGHKEFLNHQDIASWKVEYVLPRGGGWTLKFNDQASPSDQGRASLTDLVTNHINPEEMGENLGMMVDRIQIVCLANLEANLPRTVATIFRNPVHPVVGVVNGNPSIYIPKGFNALGWKLLLLRESDVLTGGIHNLDLGGINAGNTHPINGLPDLKTDEGAWLVLLAMGNQTLPIESLEILSYILPSVASCRICRITEEGVGQTFPMLLQIWLGEERELTDEERRIVRSRLDLLDSSTPRINGAQGLFARARRDRHLLGFGSPDLLLRFFEDRLLGALDEGGEALRRLLRLLLECGFNWFAEPCWIESLPTCVGTLLQECRRNFTRSRRETLKEVCPLVGSFDLIHQGRCRGIPKIDGGLLMLPHNQPEIGVTIASPGSMVPIFKTGFPYRGIDCTPKGQRLLVQRPVLWPPDHRQAISLKDTYGRFCPIILRVTDRDRASSYLEDKIGGTGSSLSFDVVTKDRMKGIFHNTLLCSGSLLGSIENPGPEETQLAVLFKACCDRFENMAEEEAGQEGRAVIYQAAVISRLHAWITQQQPALVTWPLSDPSAYDFLSKVMETIWSSPDHRRALEKHIAPIEWLITWFKNPVFFPEQP